VCFLQVGLIFLSSMADSIATIVAGAGKSAATAVSTALFAIAASTAIVGALTIVIGAPPLQHAASLGFLFNILERLLTCAQAVLRTLHMTPVFGMLRRAPEAGALRAAGPPAGGRRYGAS